VKQIFSLFREAYWCKISDFTFICGPTPSKVTLNHYLTTSELAELLRIKERKVYALASSGKIPCSRATGKLLFPKDEIELWINQNLSGENTAQSVARTNQIVGSHDPLLEWAIRESRCGLPTLFDSSMDGLNKFANGDGIATGLHIFDQTHQSWNINAVKNYCDQSPAVLVEWAVRERGLILGSQCRKPITGLKDISGIRFIPRQPEAGSQLLLESLLKRENINFQTHNWTHPARSELDAVLEVQSGNADMTFGLAAMADQFKLEFISIVGERFDLLVDRTAWFDPAWQSLLSFCKTPAFKERAAQMAGYQTDHQFQVRLNDSR
jgi:putative molybdopterin biosynthesis protein